MLVLVEVEDRVATVTMNRPEPRNAISAELHGLLDEAITSTLDARDDVGCIVLTEQAGARPSAPAWTSSRWRANCVRCSRNASAVRHSAWG